MTPEPSAPLPAASATEQDFSWKPSTPQVGRGDTGCGQQQADAPDTEEPHEAGQDAATASVASDVQPVTITAETLIGMR